MGNASWNSVDWNAHRSTASTQTRSQIFNKTGRIDPSLDPAQFAFREARDSQANPEATPIILFADCTGSMGMLAEQIIKHDLGLIMEEIIRTKPVTNPAIAIGAIGDCNSDQAPVQMTQFESATVLTEQIKLLFLEGNGGGNGGESYPFCWATAAYKTKVDSLKKRGKKGYLFTIGDESPHFVLKKEHLKQFLNLDAQEDMSASELLKHAQKDWHIFHLIVKPVQDQDVLANWRELLGERAIPVTDHTKLAAGIVGIIQVMEGQVPSKWDHSTDMVVRDVTARIVPQLKA